MLEEARRRIEKAEDAVEINRIAEELICGLLGSEYASIWIFDESRAALVRERGDGTPRELSMLDQRGVLVRSFLTVSGGIYNYLASEKDYVPALDNPDQIRMKSKIIAPVVDGDRFLGLATAYSSVRKIKNFTEDDMELMQTLAPFIAGVIYKMRPELQSERSERFFIKEELKKASEVITEKVEDIRQAHQEHESPDALMMFMANTVHDIRTPANSLYGFLDLLEGRIADPRLLQYIRNAKESAQFINDLTTSILDRISTQREREESKPAPVNPLKFFADIAAAFSANMYDKKLKYNIYIDPLLPGEILIEEVKLKRVVMNLIGNAYKFTPSGKSIDFSVTYDEKKALNISVKDTGIGIPEEKQQEIFEAFSQAEETTGMEYGGTGLGLAISAQYVAEMGGKLRLDSTLDVGSTFYFTLPVRVEREEPRFSAGFTPSPRIDILLDHSNASQAKNLMRYLMRLGIDRQHVRAIRSIGDVNRYTTHLIAFEHLIDEQAAEVIRKKVFSTLILEEELFSKRAQALAASATVVSAFGFYGRELYDTLQSRREKKILVVDDDRINIELIKAIVEEELLQVETAQEGRIALELMKRAAAGGEPYDLVYIDKHMPDISGVEVMQAYREFEREKGLKALFAVSITGDPSDAHGESGLFNLYMGKPFKKHEVKASLKVAL